MECHDRYFMIAVDLGVTGQAPHFEAVGEFFCFLLKEAIPDFYLPQK